MSDINHNRMIPLHIADQAVANCEAEIAGLKAENARLKAEVERLESMADENAHLHKGIYSLSLNVGQLKDEVERLRKAGDTMAETLEGAGFDSAMDFWNAAKEGKPSV